MISLDGMNTIQMKHVGEEAQGIDYNLRTNTIFWLSSRKHRIYTMPINGESGKKSIFRDGSAHITGLVVDWVHHHLYWVDSRNKEIGVTNLNGTMRKVLFNDLKYSKSIAVDPLNGWMYWSDSGGNQIERAGLDGSRREVIISAVSPHGLVVDYMENRLYWSQTRDEYTTSIWSSELDGSDRKQIFSSFNYNDISQIATYDKYIYFIKWNSKTVYKVNKCNSEELALFYKSNPFLMDDYLMDIKIYDATLQPEGENICLKRFRQCSHFCFPVPTLGNGSALTTTCACPDGLSLSADQQNCV